MFLCAQHGKYKATRASNECPYCLLDHKKEIDSIRKEFIVKANKIHKRKYIYDEFIFTDFMTAGIIKCKIHGKFEQSPAVHILHRAKCPKCSGSISKGEIEWLDYIEKSSNKKIERNGMLIIGKKSIRPDGLDRENKICYEFYGAYFHGHKDLYDPKEMNYKAKKTFGKLYSDTIKREEMIKKAGYRLVSIWDFEWEKHKKHMKIVRPRKKKK